MRRLRRALPLLLLPLAVAACGEGTSATGADRSALEARLQAMGVASDMVYLTEIPGYTLVPQSVTVTGDHGFGSSYVRSAGGGVIQLSVDERRSDPADCTQHGTPQAAGQEMTCERDGESWYRTTSTTHEYVREDSGRVIRLSADRDGVPRDTLREAADNTRHAGTDELAEAMPEGPADEQSGPEQSGPEQSGPEQSGPEQSGPERGDLPPEGDGAPRDPVELTEGTSG
ncbi:hypothetical protein [Wenjunlia vitaminophila]|nr:hypothetical protein [Wenjunlia vitaminophila]